MNPVSTRHPLLAALASCHTCGQARQAHALLVTSGLALHPFAVSKLVHLLATLPSTTATASSSSSSALHYADLVIGHTPSPTLFTYNTLIRAHSNSPSGPSNPSVLLFRSILQDPSRPLPNQYTFAFVLSSCCRRSREELDVGAWNAGVGSSLVSEAEQVRGQAVRRGLGTNLYVSNVVIRMYGSWGQMEEAERVFNECAGRDLFSWNSIISGYVALGEMERARKLFDQMCKRDVVSWSTLIAGYVQVF